jgi:hypothetical protein
LIGLTSVATIARRNLMALFISPAGWVVWWRRRLLR